MTSRAKPKADVVEGLVRMATELGTVLLPCVDLPEWGTRVEFVRLMRLDGQPQSEELLATVDAAGPAMVAQHLWKLGTPYFQAVERIATTHVGEERAWRIAATAYVLRGVPSKRLFVLPPDPA